MQTSLKSLLVFVRSDVKNAFSQYICVHQHGERNTERIWKFNEIHGAASGL